MNIPIPETDEKILVAAEQTGGGLEKSERELINLLLDFYFDGRCKCEGYYRVNPELHKPCSSCKIHDAINDVPESTFNKLLESIK